MVGEKRHARAPKPTEGVPLKLLKQRAYGRIRSQIKAGLIVKPDACSRCGHMPSPGKDGRSMLQAHHHAGYHRPLDIVWLCVGCHRAETPVNPLRGEQVASAKLSYAKVHDIRRRIAAGESQRSIAARYGVDRTAISHIRRGLLWALPQEVPNEQR